MAWLAIFDRNRYTFKRRLLRVFLFCGTALMVVLPITVRNYVTLNDVVLITADGGKVFFHGNARGASALEGIGLPDEGFAEEGKDQPDYAHVLFRKTASKLCGRNLSPSESSRFWFRKTLGDIFGDPKAYVVRQLKKSLYFFKDYEMHYIASAYKEYTASLSFPFIRFGVISTLSVLGMVLSLRNHRRLFPIYGVVFIYFLSGVLFLVQSRYRTPAVPYLCLFGGFAVCLLIEMMEAKRYKSAGVSVMLAGILFVASHFVYCGEIINMDRWQKATKVYYQMGAKTLFHEGRYKETVEALEKCIAIAPEFGPAYNLRGKSFAMLENYGSAMQDFERVVQLSPHMAEGYKNIGFLYLIVGNTTKAKPYLLKALSLSPEDTKVKKAVETLNQTVSSLPG
jgi:hypothetical protein